MLRKYREAYKHMLQHKSNGLVYIRRLFATQAEHKKYKIKETSKNKKKPTAGDRQTDKTASTNTCIQKVYMKYKTKMYSNF